MNKGRTKTRPKIVTIGGGTGHFALLTGLKKLDVDITAVVTMADSGGSTGLLRDELGVLPPGDVRQCLVALSEGDKVLRALFTHRFTKGTLKGHTCGNLLISALEQVTGSIEDAVAHAGDVLKIRGKVIPVSLEDMRLRMMLNNGKVLKGEHEIDEYQHISRFGVKTLELKPKVRLNPDVRTALRNADLVVVGPGDLYTSLLPNLLVTGMTTALARSPAKKVYVSNLMNKYGQTDGFTVCEVVDVFRKLLRKQLFDMVLYNDTLPPKKLLQRYLDEGEPVHFHMDECPAGVQVVGANLLTSTAPKKVKGDVLQRSFIRHNPDKLAQAIIEVL